MVKSVKEILDESSPSRIWQHSQNRTIGMMSAFRGDETMTVNLGNTI
jgi:hypothetical protein